MRRNRKPKTGFNKSRFAAEIDFIRKSGPDPEIKKAEEELQKALDNYRRLKQTLPRA